MAEFNYKQEPTPSFPLDPTKEHRSIWWIKRKVLPAPYWTRMLAGAQHERRFCRSKKLSATSPLALVSITLGRCGASCWRNAVL
jgi:hypothetical protein